MGTSTRDPHHGDRSSKITTLNLYTSDAGSTNGIDGKIRSFAQSYSGSWSYPFGQNCHSFQEEFIKTLKLTTNPKND